MRPDPVGPKIEADRFEEGEGSATDGPPSCLEERVEDITPVSERVLDWKPKTAVSLRNYLKRWVWVSYAAYLLSAILVVSSLFALGVYAAGRWTFYNPPYGHPVVLFHIGHALIILIVFFLWLWPKVRRPQSMTQVAARIERGDRKSLSKRTGDDDPLEFILEGRDDRLASGVTSALEFSDPDPLLEQCLIPSRNLLAGSGRTSETIGLYERVLTDLQKRRVWKWVVPTTFWVSIGVAGVVGLGAYFLDRIEPFTWQDAWKFYQSHFLVDPYRPQHELVVNPGSNQTVLRGESLKVWGILIGPGTHQATITYNMLGFPEQTVEMKNNGPPNSFVFEFENLQSDLTYRVKSGPLESPQYEAKVRIPPELTSIRLTYFYPEFMKKNFEVMPAGQGAAIAPMGTTVEVTTRWNQPMDSVSIIVNGEQPIPMTLGGNYHKGRFPLTSAGSYILAGTSSEGVRTRADLEFPIQALVDLPPEIEWVFPVEDLDFSSSKKRHLRIPLRFTTRDDFGLHSILLYAGAPGRPTATYEVARLDGMEREYSGEYILDLRPYENSPVCRVFFMSVDNHPGIQGRTITEVRRLYFQPPGTFSEEEDDGRPDIVEGDPYELTANELFSLLKLQEAQNQSLNDEVLPKDVEKTDWLTRQRKLVELTTRTVVLAKERSDRLRSLPKDQESDRGDLSMVTVVEGEKPPGLEDLSTRLLQVVNRLSGGIARLEELQPGKQPTGTSALDRQLRQWDSGEADRGQRSREEGDRAYREIELAFKELTGKDLPAPADEELEELEKEDALAAGDQPGKDGKQGEQPGESGESEEEGEEGEEETTKKPKPPEGVDPETWALSLDDEKKGDFVPGSGGEGGQGEEEKEEVISGVGPSTPSNQYAPSEYTLDPDTVRLDAPAATLMRKEVSKQLSGLDLSQYRDPEIPSEYRDSAAEYSRVLMGD